MLIAGTIGTSTWCFARGVDSEFRWAVITDVGNAPYTSSGIGGPRGGLVYPFAEGRGSVDYVYRISTLEVTTTQWMEFLNAIAPLQPTALTWGRPSHWGAEDDPSQPSGNYRLRSDVPNAGMIPVHAVSWRHAAMYVNWLCNDKRATLSAIANGAYDISTFGENPDGTITDQLTHNLDAKYWIPTYDEWIKAAHYDPNKNGEGQGGWWRFMYSQDTALTYGWPGEGQSAGGGSARRRRGFRRPRTCRSARTASSYRRGACWTRPGARRNGRKRCTSGATDTSSAARCTRRARTGAFSTILRGLARQAPVFRWRVYGSRRAFRRRGASQC